MVSFRLFSIPIQIRGSFLLISLLLGWGAQNLVPPQLAWFAVLIWMVVVAISVLIHELGHALTGRAFGLEPRVELHGMGGTTSWAGRGRDLGPARSIVVSLAGPAVGIVVGSFALVATIVLAHTLGPIATTLLSFVVWVNLGWGLLNLLPMLPLDGGNVMASALEAIMKGRGRRTARIVSIVVAVAAGAVAVALGSIFSAMLCGLFVFTNFQALRQEAAFQVEKPLWAELERGFAAVERGDARAAIRAAEEVLSKATTPQTRAPAIELLAWGRLADGDVRGAEDALSTLPAGALASPLLRGLILLEKGDSDHALPLLEDAYAQRPDDLSAGGLGRAYVARGEIDKALALIDRTRHPERGPVALELVERALYDNDRLDEAARVGERHFEATKEGRVAFNLACTYARAGRNDKALEWLSRAKSTGFDVAKHARDDEDLAAVRALPAYAELVGAG